MATRHGFRTYIALCTVGLLGACANTQDFDDDGTDTEEAPAVTEQATLDAVGRQQFLLARKNDIEYQFGIIQQRLSMLSYQSAQLAISYANDLSASGSMGVSQTLENGVLKEGSTSGNVISSDGASSYAASQQMIDSMKKQLELRALDLQVQAKEIEAELAATKTVIDKTIDQSFKYQT
jgi:hypothetical protein